MLKRVLRLCCLFSVVMLAGSCRKKAFDEFYGRPGSLAPPIYQQLQAKGNFTNLLVLIDKSGYKQTLSASGSWTFFAANDEAFKKYFQEAGISGIAAISDQQAEAIVRYSMVYDAEKSDRLSDYFSSKGFIENAAWRRRTVYYDFVYDGKNAQNEDIKVIAYNRNSPTAFVATDFNNKNIPVFLDAYMQIKGLGAADYEAFYPGSTYSGFNVGPASVLADQKDIEAENGVIHVVDHVLVPPLSIDQYINQTADYSAFKNLLDKFVTYNVNADISHKYAVLSGKTANVYVKTYAGLAYSPNNENYMKADANDAQTDSYSIVAPNNAAVARYAKEVLLKYYPSGTTLDQLAVLRSDIIQAFVNAHMFTNALWPGKFNNTPNYLGENLNLNQANDVVEKKALSNGLFYGTSKAQNANIFASVYGKVFLDPKFSIMRAALDRYGFTTRLQSPSSKYMLIPIADAILQKAGFTYNPQAFPNNPIRFNGNTDEAILKHIVGTHVIDLNGRESIPDINAGEGFLLSAANEPDNYEYIRYKNGQLFSAGTIDSSYTAINGTVPGTHPASIGVDSLASGSNGPVIYSKGLLMYTDNNVGASIERGGMNPTDPYYYFFQYLKNNINLYNPATKQIIGVDLGISYTIFIPTNAQMLQAVRDGVLPGTFTSTTVTPTLNPTDEDQKNLVERFIRYHILNKVTIAADGNLLRKGLKETLLKNGLGDPVVVNITENTTTSLKVQDSFGNIATVINPLSSLLANRTVIHQIDTYLKYSF